MNTFPVSLKRTLAATDAPAAWLLPPSGTAMLVSRIGNWPVPHAQLRLHGTPAGLFVLLPKQAGWPPLPDAQAYRCLAGVLYLPVDAELSVQVSDADLRARFSVPHIWHPARGLFELTDEQEFSVGALLEPPERIPTLWDAARITEPVAAQLVSVSSEYIFSMETIFRESQGDIGGQSNELMRGIDPQPGQPAPNPTGKSQPAATGRVNKLLAKMLQGLGASAGRIARALGQTQTPAWAKSLENWIARQTRSPAAALQELRDQQLRKLLSMLESNPEEGLKFALPLNNSPGRGTGQDGNELTRRNVNFDLGSALGSGGPTGSPWETSHEIFQSLTQRYRAVAERELKLGRHRRAAYIYSQLLGDHFSAAAVLKQGQHFCEAAVLFRDRLAQPLQAAECFTLGAMFDEALRIYIEQKRYETAGELWQKLEQPEEARRCFRLAVDELLQVKQRLAAARLVEKHLEDPDEALEILAEGWPGHSEAGACLGARFDLLGRLNRHAAARDLITELETVDVPFTQADTALRRIVMQFESYPDAETRQAARHAALSMISAQLVRAHPAGDTRWAALVPRLTPDDRILERDAARYPQLRTRDATVARAVTNVSRPKVEQTGKLALPRGVTWKTAARMGDKICVLGVTDHTPLLCWIDRAGEQHLTRWAKVSALYSTCEWQLHLDSSPSAMGCVIPLGAPPLPPCRAPVWSDGTPPFSVGTPAWLPHAMLAVTSDSAGSLWVVRLDDNQCQMCAVFTKFGFQQTSWQLADAAQVTAQRGMFIRQILEVSPQMTLPETLEFSPPDCKLEIAERTGFLAWGPVLGTFMPGGALDCQRLSSEVRQIASGRGLDASADTVVIATTNGLLLASSDLEHPLTPLPGEISQPTVAVLPSGDLVCVGEGAAFVTRLKRHRAQLIVPFHCPEPVLPAILGGDRANEFCVITTAGVLTTFGIG